MIAFSVKENGYSDNPMSMAKSNGPDLSNIIFFSWDKINDLYFSKQKQHMIYAAGTMFGTKD